MLCSMCVISHLNYCEARIRMACTLVNSDMRVSHLNVNRFERG